MVRSATQRLGSGPRNFFGSGGSRTHSNQTVEIVEIAARLPFSARFGRMLDHLDAPSEMFLDPFFTRACVALINPQMLSRRGNSLAASSNTNGTAARSCTIL